MSEDKLIKNRNNAVLIVDDVKETLRFLTEILIADGYSVSQASCGEHALQSIKLQLPDIILLDVMMPEMDGFEVCRQIKANPETSAIPVIFISALVDDQSKVKGLKIGAVDYIIKPFSKVEVLARVKIHIEAAQMRAQLERQTIDLQIANNLLQTEIAKRKQAEAAMEKRIVALTQPLDEKSDILFEELFNLHEIQKLQDQFSDAFGVASIITRPDGTPITQPSNFSRLCQNIIRCTEKGLKNCMHSDAIIGRQNTEGPIVQPCLSGGLWDAGSSITVGGLHIANWLIGQVRNESQDEQGLKDYAQMIGANVQEFMKAHAEVTVMSEEQFRKVSEVLFTMSGQISQLAYQNIQQARFINERKMAELALQESEERFRTTVYSIGDGVITTDTEGRIRLMNQLAEQLTGWKQDEAFGKSLEDVFKIINEENRNEVEIPVRKVLREGVTVGLANHTLLIAKDDTERPIADSGAPIRNEKDEIVGVVLVFRDQTVDRRAEQALIESEKRFRLLYENAPLSYQSLNPQARLIDVNPTWLRTMGYSERDEVIGRHFGEFMTAESAELIKARFPHFVAAGEIHNYVFDMVRKDGRIITVSYEGRIGYDELGQFKQTHCIFSDITEQKKAEQALFESEEMMRNSQSVAHICSYSTNLNVNDIGTSSWVCSPEFYQLFGIDKTYPHTLEGWAGLIHPDYREELVAYFEYVIKERISFEHEYKIIRMNDGAERWVFGTGKLEMDEKGIPIRIHGAIQDITESKRNVEIIQNERQLLRTLIDNLPVTVYIKDEKARKIVANTLDLATIGIMDETAVIGKTDLELFDNEIGRRGYEDDLNVIRTGYPVLNREEYFFNDRGEKSWLLTSKMPLHGPDGKPIGLVGIGRDITAQKKSELQIQKLTESIEQSPSSIVITDTYGTIEYVNPKFSKITGYTKEEVIGQNPRILKSGEMPSEKYKELWDIIATGGIWRGEFHNRKKNGEFYWEWATITSIKNNHSEITNYIAIKEDISLRKQMEVDLIVAKEKAEESDRLKSAFLANMSHEIRTPLNSIIGFSELLADSDFLNDQKVEFVGHIIRSGNNLLNIISDIVDISKIEAGEITIWKSMVQVKNLMKEIHSLHTLNVEEKFLQFRITCLLSEEDEDIFVIADKERLQQIFNNLIGNALKFTSSGYIEVGCEPSGDMIQFYVKDTGIGIPKAFLDLIFDRFRQVETSLTRKFGGNGLGLAISKNLVELMGGTIWAESEVGKGSTFYFTLPAS